MLVSVKNSGFSGSCDIAREGSFKSLCRCDHFGRNMREETHSYHTLYGFLRCGFTASALVRYYKSSETC